MICSTSKMMLLLIFACVFCGCAPSYTTYTPILGHTVSGFFQWAGQP